MTILAVDQNQIPMNLMTIPRH